MAPGTAAPIRDPSRNDFKSPLKKAARRIVTAPTFNVIRTIDFDKKSEYEKFIQFIDSSNKELAKIKLKKPEIDSRLASILPLYLPDMTTMAVQGKSLQLSWFKRILDNWKKFVKWFKQTKWGKRLRNLLAGWKNLKRKIKNLIKWIKDIKWKDILTNIKNSRVGKFLKEILKWFKKPPKFPKWSTDIVKRAKDAFSRLKSINFDKIVKDFTQNMKRFQKKFFNKQTLQDLSKAKSLIGRGGIWTMLLNLGGSSYRPELQEGLKGDRARDLKAWQFILSGKRWDSDKMKTIDIEGGDLNKVYEKFKKEKFSEIEEIVNLKKELDAINPLDAEARSNAEAKLAAAKDKYRSQIREQFIEQNPVLKERVNDTDQKILDKLLTPMSKDLDLSSIYSMDSSMFEPTSTFFNNAPQLYVMESEGKTQYVPFTAGASSDSSSSSFMEIDYSQVNSKLFDELRFIKLSSG